MPWRGADDELPSLGDEVGTWIEEHCAIPDGDRMGEQYMLTEEMWDFLLAYYRLVPETGEFFYRRGQLVRPQKWGKGPFSAAIICAEAAGPVLFSHWGDDGRPYGRPWSTPWVQVTAVSEDQTVNVWRALVPMIELGAVAADMPDTGETRINLPGGGRIEPVTSSARSRLGQRITFAVQDETHSWLKANGGRALADNQRRNLAGMGGRSIETTNAWDPADESVAQQTHESTVADILKDYGDGGPGSINNKRERRRVLSRLYKQCWWVSLDRIDAEIEELLPRDPAQAERFFLNRIIAEGDRAFDVEQWKRLARPGVETAPQASITLGFDGARFFDSTALVATEVESGRQWVAGVWERPEHGEGWEVPVSEVVETVDAMFARFRVLRLYADPPHWDEVVDRWAGKWGDKVVFKWWTNRDRPMAYALRAYRTSMSSGELSHDGDEVFARHVGNARRRNLKVRDDEGRPMWTIGKDRPGSPRKIDLVMAGCLSWEARGDAIAAGALKPAGRRSWAF